MPSTAKVTRKKISHYQRRKLTSWLGKKNKKTNIRNKGDPTNEMKSVYNKVEWLVTIYIYCILNNNVQITTIT